MISDDDSQSKSQQMSLESSSLQSPGKLPLELKYLHKSWFDEVEENAVHYMDVSK